MKRFALSRTASKSTEDDLPLNFGTMQNVHFPAQPSCTLRYARAVRVGMGAPPCAFLRAICGWGAAIFEVRAAGMQPSIKSRVFGYFFLMCAMSCSQSRWARRVTEQPRTTMTSASECLFVSFHPPARYSASCSSASARFSLQPNVSKQTFMVEIIPYFWWLTRP